MHNLNFQPWKLLFGVVVIFLFVPVLGAATLINGTNLTAMLASGAVDRHIFTVSSGDFLTLTAANQSSTSHQPGIDLYLPDGSIATSVNGGQVASIALRVSSGGTCTAAVYNAISTASFTYILRLAELNRSFVVPAGDEGGLLPNGIVSSGSLPKGDIDIWSFDGNAGDTVILRAGGSTIVRLDLMTATGVLYSTNALNSGDDTGMQFRLSAAGNNIISVHATTLSATGNYSLSLVRLMDPALHPTSLTNAVTVSSNLAPGSVGLWVLRACKNNPILLRCAENAGQVFPMRLELFSTMGVCVASNQANSTVTLNYVPAYSGTYAVLVQGGSPGGRGPFTLRGDGLPAAGLRLCDPVYSDGSVWVGALNGVPNGPFTLLTNTKLVEPITAWPPLLQTNFNDYGEFEFQGLFPADLERYFLLRSP